MWKLDQFVYIRLQRIPFTVILSHIYYRRSFHLISAQRRRDNFACAKKKMRPKTSLPPTREKKWNSRQCACTPTCVVRWWSYAICGNVFVGKQTADAITFDAAAAAKEKRVYARSYYWITHSTLQRAMREHKRLVAFTWRNSRFHMRILCCSAQQTIALPVLPFAFAFAVHYCRFKALKHYCLRYDGITVGSRFLRRVFLLFALRALAVCGVHDQWLAWIVVNWRKNSFRCGYGFTVSVLISCFCVYPYTVSLADLLYFQFSVCDLVDSFVTWFLLQFFFLKRELFTEFGWKSQKYFSSTRKIWNVAEFRYGRSKCAENLACDSELAKIPPRVHVAVLPHPHRC